MTAPADIATTNAEWQNQPRTCPRCRSEFVAKYDRGQCPKCRHVFYASHPDIGDTLWVKETKPPLPPVPERYQTGHPFLNLVRMSFDQIAEFRRDGRKTLEGWNLFNAIPLIMSHAVRIHTDEAGVHSEFESHQGVEQLERLATLVIEFFLSPAKPMPCPFGAPSGVTDLLDAIHISWFVRRFDLAHTFCQVAANGALLDTFMHKPMWREYTRGSADADSGREYHVSAWKPTGGAKHILTDMQLLAAVTRTRSSADALAAVDKSFVVRNRDRRLQDMPLIDGDATFPAKFHFRKAAFLAIGSEKFA